MMNEYQKRRQNFFQQMKENSLAILPAASEISRNNDMEYPFRQNSDLLYLTGFDEPNAFAIFEKGDTGNRFILFCMTRDPIVEQWVGYRYGVDRARELFGADEAYAIDEIDQHLPELMFHKETIYFPIGRYRHIDQQVIVWLNTVRAQLRSGINMPSEIINLEAISHEMRLIKSDAEIEKLQKACDINIEAFLRLFSACVPGKFEYELAAELEYIYRKNGVNELAFGTIVGSGENSTILHYTQNNRQIKSGDILLVDAGCVLNYYPSDITRTMPANGKFTKEQLAIYELVLAMQTAALEKMKPGQRYIDPHQAAIRVCVEGLKDLGILTGDLDSLIETEAYRPFYMHKLSHWIGLDDHDPSAYKVNREWRTLESGMVLSAEPGVYIKAGLKGVDERWWNIGVRIEDDILITEKGHRNFTKALPKQPAEIEQLVGK